MSSPRRTPGGGGSSQRAAPAGAHPGGIATQPARSDSCWERRCQPLLRFLARPRNWEELTEWASIRGISGCRLRNMLAWLEDEHTAGAFADNTIAPPARLRHAFDQVWAAPPRAAETRMRARS